MQLQDALRDAPAFVRNAQETAQRSPVNADTLYLWDNQVTAIESFLANTEDHSGENGDLAKARKELFELKRSIQNKVLEFELKEEGQEMPPEPTEEELLADFVDYGKEMEKLAKDVAKAPLKTVKDIDELEGAREQMSSFLVDTEPHVAKDAALAKSRTLVKETRAQLEARIADLLREWRKSDVDDGDE